MSESYLITWRSGDWLLLDIDTKHCIASGKDTIADRPIQIATEKGYSVIDYYTCLPSFEFGRYREYLEHEYGAPRLADKREG